MNKPAIALLIGIVLGHSINQIPRGSPENYLNRYKSERMNSGGGSTFGDVEILDSRKEENFRVFYVHFRTSKNNPPPNFIKEVVNEDDNGEIKDWTGKVFLINNGLLEGWRIID